MKANWKIFLLLMFLMGNFAHAQNFPVDTSFTLHSDYKKQVKYYPDIKPVWPTVGEQVMKQKDLVYAKYGEREMHIDLYSPKEPGAEKLPAVILIHGGGWNSGNKIMEAPMAIYLAAHGFVTATVEYRLSPEAKYPAGVTDVKTAIRWLRKNAGKYGIDSEKFAILGTSAGGQMAALIGTTGHSELYFDHNFYPGYSDEIQAIVDIDGVLCFIHPESSEGLDKPGKPSAATLWFGSNKTENKPIWDEASALYHTDLNTPPVLFINSQHPRFHAGRDDMMAKLDSLGIYSEVHTIPETPHTFWLYEPWFDEAARYTEQFLTKLLMKDN